MLIKKNVYSGLFKYAIWNEKKALLSHGNCLIKKIFMVVNNLQVDLKIWSFSKVLNKEQTASWYSTKKTQFMEMQNDGNNDDGAFFHK